MGSSTFGMRDTYATKVNKVPALSTSVSLKFLVS